MSMITIKPWKCPKYMLINNSYSYSIDVFIAKCIKKNKQFMQEIIRQIKRDNSIFEKKYFSPNSISSDIVRK